MAPCFCCLFVIFIPPPWNVCIFAAKEVHESIWWNIWLVFKLLHSILLSNGSFTCQWHTKAAGMRTHGRRVVTTCHALSLFRSSIHCSGIREWWEWGSSKVSRTQHSWLPMTNSAISFCGSSKKSCLCLYAMVLKKKPCSFFFLKNVLPPGPPAEFLYL